MLKKCRRFQRFVNFLRDSNPELFERLPSFIKPEYTRSIHSKANSIPNQNLAKSPSLMNNPHTDQRSY